MSTKLTSGISHVGLAVSNLAASLHFFEAIGYQRVGGVDDYPSHFLVDGNSMITLWQTNENATPFDRRNNVGLHHLAIQVPSLEALQKVYILVSAIDGVRTEGEGAFGPNPLKGTSLTHAMVYEPSGNRIEFTYHKE